MNPLKGMSNRRAFSVSDEADMIRYLISEHKEGRAQYPCGNQVWKKYYTQGHKDRSVESYQSKPQYLMDTVTCLTAEEILYALKAFKWPVTCVEQSRLERKWNYVVRVQGECVVGYTKRAADGGAFSDDEEDDVVVESDGDDQPSSPVPAPTKRAKRQSPARAVVVVEEEEQEQENSAPSSHSNATPPPSTSKSKEIVVKKWLWSVGPERSGMAESEGRRGSSTAASVSTSSHRSLVSVSATSANHFNGVSCSDRGWDDMDMEKLRQPSTKGIDEWRSWYTRSDLAKERVAFVCGVHGVLTKAGLSERDPVKKRVMFEWRGLECQAYAQSETYAEYQHVLQKLMEKVEEQFPEKVDTLQENSRVYVKMEVEDKLEFTVRFATPKIQREWYAEKGVDERERVVCAGMQAIREEKALGARKCHAIMDTIVACEQICYEAADCEEAYYRRFFDFIKKTKLRI